MTMDDRKKFRPPLETDSEFFPRTLANGCAPLAVRFLIDNYYTRGRCNFTGLPQDGQAKSAENIHDSPFNKDPSNETTIIQIHLTGHWTVPLNTKFRANSGATCCTLCCVVIATKSKRKKANKSVDNGVFFNI
jgi:hypothetical protein